MLLPLSADHAFNASRCRVLGMARVLDTKGAVPEEVRQEAREVLGDRALKRTNL